MIFCLLFRMLCHLTASCRFHGDMNVDMNEICTNLVVCVVHIFSPSCSVTGWLRHYIISLSQPYPDIPFLMTAMSPYRASSSTNVSSRLAVSGRSTGRDNVAVNVPKTMVQRGFTDLLSVHGQISAAVPCDKASRSTTLAAAFLVRGQVSYILKWYFWTSWLHIHIDHH
jgi:hypothetical protein